MEFIFYNSVVDVVNDLFCNVPTAKQRLLKEKSYFTWLTERYLKESHSEEYYDQILEIIGTDTSKYDSIFESLTDDQCSKILEFLLCVYDDRP